LTRDPSEAPVTTEEFGARLKALNIRSGFAIAVSGGRDSMALVRLAADYRVGAAVPILALTVDHGLRKASAAEAAQVADWCEKAGLPHKTLVWTGDKPTSGIQEAARHARYRLLASAVQEAGLDTLLVAHSADDQTETVFMRLARGAGPRGLSAMQETAFIAAGAGAPVRLVRPLLGCSRAQLTATVRAFRQPYVDDPSNDDPGFERIRTRALLAALEEQKILTQKALLRSAGRMRKAERRLRVRERSLFRSLSGCFYGWGGAAIDLRGSIALNVGDAGDLFRRLIFAVSGEMHAPDDDATEEAFAKACATGSATLGGALLKVSRDHMWFLREPAAVLGRTGVAAIKPLRLAPGEKALWDNRFIVSLPDDAEEGAVVSVMPVGEAGAEALGSKKALFQGPREGLLAMPGAYHNDILIGVPAPLSMAGSNISMVSLADKRFEGEVIRFS
jgi:tRNA(Ile)-lysidine synthase